MSIKEALIFPINSDSGNALAAIALICNMKRLYAKECFIIYVITQCGKS